jgi:antitoxin HigA-1
MINEISILKGIHPGFILDRKLKERKLRKRPFALSIDEHPQTLSAITNGKRSFNTPLALKIEHALGLEEGYFMTLQVFYDIKELKHKQQQHSHSDLSLIRPADKLKHPDDQYSNLSYKSNEKKMIKPILYHSFEEKEQIERDLFATMPEEKRKALAVELMSIFHTPVEARKRKTSKKASAKR